MSVLQVIRRHTLVEILGYAGLIPFIGAALVIPLGVTEALPFFMAYSAMILAFMAGACWGVVQGRHDAFGHLAPSVSIAVFLWGLAVWWFNASLGAFISLGGLLAGYVS